MDKAQGGFILDPNTQEPIAITTVKLDAEDAALLRRYKKFLERYGLKEALYCDGCWERDLSHGLEAYVTSDKVFLKCRCSLRIFDGPTY